MNRLIFLAILLLLNFVSANELPYNYQDTTSIPIELNVFNELSSKDEIYEGQEINLRVKNDVVYNNKVIVSKGTIAKTKIETIVTKGMNGFPAEIILDNFKIDGIKDSQLISKYKKAGRNFAILIYPIKWALTPIPFVGSLTNLIHGGEAKIKETDVITIQYYPNWK